MSKKEERDQTLNSMDREYRKRDDALSQKEDDAMANKDAQGVQDARNARGQNYEQYAEAREKVWNDTESEIEQEEEGGCEM